MVSWSFDDSSCTSQPETQGFLRCGHLSTRCCTKPTYLFETALDRPVFLWVIPSGIQSYLVKMQGLWAYGDKVCLLNLPAWFHLWSWSGCWWKTFAVTCWSNTQVCDYELNLGLISLSRVFTPLDRGNEHILASGACSSNKDMKRKYSCRLHHLLLAYKTAGVKPRSSTSAEAVVH